MPKLTKRLIENAESRDKGYFIFDSELRGFGFVFCNLGANLL